MPGAADWGGHRGGARGDQGVIHSLANAGSGALVLLAEEQPDKMANINIHIRKHAYVLTYTYTYKVSINMQSTYLIQHTLQELQAKLRESVLRDLVLAVAYALVSVVPVLSLKRRTAHY